MAKELTKEEVMECLDYLASAHEDLRIAVERCKKDGVDVLAFNQNYIQIHQGLAETDIEAERSEFNETYDQHTLALNGVTFIQLEVRNR